MRFAAFAAALAFQDLAVAVQLGIQGTLSKRFLSSRASISGQSTLTDSLNLEYSTNITLGGQIFECLIDTGRYGNCTSTF